MEPYDPILAAIDAHFGRQIAFLQRLVRANSVNPFTSETASPDIAVEQEVAAAIQQELHQLGFSAELVGVTPQRPNVLCHVSNGDVGKTLILTTHMDTVAPDGYTRDPWGAHIEDGRLYGVGAADAKAQIAAMVYALHALRYASLPLHGRVTLAFVVDEETGACSPFGTQYLLEQGYLRGDGVIIGEPGNSKIAIGHRGLYRFYLTIFGEAIHTGMRAWEQGKQGRNAILDMARVIQVLSEYPLPVTPSPVFPNRKSVFTFPTLIRGGSGINMVPASCEAYGDVRLLPGLSAAEVKTLIITVLKRLSIEHYRLDDDVMISAAETDPQAEIVQTLAASVEAITGVRPSLEGSGPACDGWMFLARDIPTVCGYGVTCGGVHGADEWVDLDSLRQVTAIYAITALKFLRESGA